MISPAVAYPTKILFWKRITAILSSSISFKQLLLILQRYYFESESQRWSFSTSILGCCCLSYKDTILKANHSICSFPNPLSLLLLILQRYYFESESQLPDLTSQYKQCCCLSYKDTILKANHSPLYRSLATPLAVAYPTKILFWKRITARKNDRSMSS